MRDKAYKIFAISYITFSTTSELNIIMKNIYMHEMITCYKSFFWKTFLVEVLNKLYVRT
jgi:hypothetical protein